MQIDIYTSSNNGKKHLSVPKGVKVESLELPADFDTDLLSLSPLRTRLEIEAGKEHKTLDQADIIKQIEEKGYAVHGTRFEITLSVTSNT